MVSHVFHSLITKILRTDNDGSMDIWGDGTETRDFLYVSDLVDLLKLMIKNGPIGKFNIFNVGSGKRPTSIMKLAETMAYLSGKNIVSIGTRIDEPTIKTKLWLDTSKVKKFYGWEPKIGLDEGIKKTFSWINSRLKI